MGPGVAVPAEPDRADLELHRDPQGARPGQGTPGAQRRGSLCADRPGRRALPRRTTSPSRRALPSCPAPPRPAGPAPGWYPNPGGPGQRYWDGVTWTHWTHPR
uniref:DUF2510 domain-containing protein n=1 Tax=Mycobacterium stomatepiae TaxID=470076 RepID=UPI001E39EAEB|nr:DUF2510 domain-containing protein [Mycobacterium stomatepiae]